MEMDIQNGAKFVWRRQAGKEVLRDPWRRAEDHGIVRAELLLRPVEVERNGAFLLEPDRPKAVAEPNRRTPRCEKSERGIDETARKPMGGEQRVAGLSSRGESLAQQSRGQRWPSFPGDRC